MSNFRLFIWMSFMVVLLSMVMMVLGGLTHNEDLSNAGGGVFGATLFVGVFVAGARCL